MAYFMLELACGHFLYLPCEEFHFIQLGMQPMDAIQSFFPGL